MFLVDLHPDTGTADGYKTSRRFLSFDCMKCGPPYRCYVQYHRDAPIAGIWQATSPWRLFPNLEHLGEMPDLKDLTLVPSIQYNTHGPKHPTCGWHFSIIDGKIHL